MAIYFGKIQAWVQLDQIMCGGRLFGGKGMQSSLNKNSLMEGVGLMIYYLHGVDMAHST